jgi:hypothetical protein
MGMFSKTREVNDKESSKEGGGYKSTPPKVHMKDLIEHASWRGWGSKFILKADEQELLLL